MKFRCFVLGSLILALSLPVNLINVSAQDWANLNRYRHLNDSIMRVDSISFATPQSDEATRTIQRKAKHTDFTGSNNSAYRTHSQAKRSNKQARDELSLNKGGQAKVPGRVVFMGNSITDNWMKFHPEFFTNNGFIGRGISGQTTPQMLIRFRQDVVKLLPETVVILAGTNDIAGNTGPSTFEMILDNIAGMCEIAKANKINVILCSVLPAKQYRWRKEIRPDTLIPQFNIMLKNYAQQQHIQYVDFFSAMVDTTNADNVNGLPLELSKDGVHPTLEGYKIMEKMILRAIKAENKSHDRVAKSHSSRTLKLMSYNIRNCKGMDGQFNIDRVAKVIMRKHPNVVALQEIDSVTNRYDSKYILGELAERTSMYATYAPAISFGGGKYGIGILSREKPLKYKVVGLPGKEEQRALLIAEFRHYIVCCTHLSLTKEDRLKSCDIINNEIEKFTNESTYRRKPVFLAGDWNDTPDSKFIKRLQRNFTIVSNTHIPTFPSDVPDRTIDYIAIWNPTLQLAKLVSDTRKPAYIVISNEASDHRAILGRFMLLSPETSPSK